MTEIQHGTINGYSNQACRCDECKKAWRAYNTPQRDADGRTYELRGRQMPEDVHGTVDGYYNWKCRCNECFGVFETARGPLWGKPKQRVAEHGTPSRYTGHGCRCAECKKAWSDYCKPVRNEDGRTITLRGKTMPVSAHGTDGGYKRWNCRCYECKQMHALYQKQYREVHPQTQY